MGEERERKEREGEEGREGEGEVGKREWVISGVGGEVAVVGIGVRGEGDM